MDAPGGSGKTFVTSAIHCFLKSRDVRFFAVSSSSVAAQLLNDDKTAHSALKILILVISGCTCHIDVDSQLVQELIHTKRNIRNEIVMIHK